MTNGMVPEPTTSGIYEIVNTLTGVRYVGSAVNFNKRWYRHRRELRLGAHHSKYLQSAWNRYTASVFDFRVLVECPKEHLLECEQLLLDMLSPAYNMCLTAGSQAGRKDSLETKRKRAASLVGNKHALGHVHDDQSKAKMSAAGKGRKKSPESIAATARAHTGMVRSAETRERIAAKARGRKRSPESVEKGAAKRRGAVMPPRTAGEKAARLAAFRASLAARTDEERAAIQQKRQATLAAKKGLK